MAKKKKATKKSKSSKKRKSTRSSQHDFSFQGFYESLKDAILVMDDNCKVIYANTSIQALTGYGKSISEVHLKDLFKYSCKRKVESACQVVFANKENSEQTLSDLKLCKKNGRKIHVDFSIKYLQDFKTPAAVVSIHDLSDMIEHQKEKEAYLRELNHMSKLADIGRLTAGVAHELNNPLMIIQGFSENLQILFESGDFDKQEILQQIDPIVKASDRMAKIISTMMKLAGDDDVYMVHVDLVEVVEDALQLVRNQIRDLEIVIEKDFSSGHGVVNCDPSQVEQIVLNILNNAMHALEENAPANRKIKISVDKESTVNLRIWNNGPAIPLDLQDRIMSPFFTTKAVGEGTGLGLSLSYGIMKAHDGDLTFISSKSQGTEFSLCFPEPALAEIQSASKVQRKFLIVDDEEFIRNLMEHKLRRYGYEVISAGDGFEALEMLKNNKDVECVFTDIRMPKMDGTQLIKEIKKMESKPLIYAISGYAGRKSLELKVQRLGINGFLTKPIDHMLFSHTINEIEEHLSYIHGKSKRAG